jgi:hypothetical protein
MQKTIFTRTLAFAAAVMLSASACRKTEITPQQPEQLNAQSAMRKSAPQATSSDECGPSPYTITLDKVCNNNNTWTWTWTVKNPNPGNGNGNTLQDLSHWGFTFMNCPGPYGLSISDVASAAYSSNGTNWTSFTPTYQADPSISGSGVSGPVLKFDFGTSGSANSYYRLVLSRDFAVEEYCGAYFKSGSKTGVKTGRFLGPGCGGGTND